MITLHIGWVITQIQITVFPLITFRLHSTPHGPLVRCTVHRWPFLSAILYTAGPLLSAALCWVPFVCCTLHRWAPFVRCTLQSTPLGLFCPLHSTPVGPFVRCTLHTVYTSGPLLSAALYTGGLFCLLHSTPLGLFYPLHSTLLNSLSAALCTAGLLHSKQLGLLSAALYSAGEQNGSAFRLLFSARWLTVCCFYSLQPVGVMTATAGADTAPEALPKVLRHEAVHQGVHTTETG